MFAIDLEEIDKLGATRCFTGTCQLATAGEGIEGTGFARIGASGKRNFPTCSRGALIKAGGTDQKAGSPIVEGGAVI